MLLLLLCNISAVCVRALRPVSNSFKLATALSALRRGSLVKLEKLSTEYSALMQTTTTPLENDRQRVNQRMRNIRLVFDCVRALKSVDYDLEMLHAHNNSHDITLKKSAVQYLTKFLELKDELEIQLDKVLWET